MDFLDFSDFSANSGEITANSGEIAANSGEFAEIIIIWVANKSSRDWLSNDRWTPMDLLDLCLDIWDLFNCVCCI